MNRKTLQKIVIMLLLILFMCSINSIVIATGYSTINIGTIVDGAEDKSDAGDSVLNIIGALLTVIQVAAMGIALIMLIVLAIKYISSSPSDKADIKKSATIYVVGAVILFSASGIIGIIRKFSVKNINNE